MRKVLSIMLIVLALLSCGCERSEPVPEKGDFSFTLPEGYSIGQITDKDCVITGKEGTAIGGIRLAEMTLRDHRDSDGPAIPRYLDGLVEGCEFFSWVEGDKKAPVRFITQQFTDPDTRERRILYRILFIKDGGVYDMWFDTGLISEDEIQRFHPIALQAN